MKTWFITGTSSGFGRAIAEAALAAGDRVVATARNVASVADLVEQHGADRVATVALDVTDHQQIRAAVAEAEQVFGGIDVLVNNAGYGSVGAVEETTDEDARRHFDVHVHGPIELIRRVLPGMRARRSGAIVNLSSFGGYVAYPGFGTYCATKFALEGYSEALAAEVAPFGITVLVAQPGAFRTGFGGQRMHRSPQIDAYADTPVAGTRRAVDAMDDSQPGDPARAAALIIDALAADQPPLRLAIGADAVDGIRAKLARQSAELEAWSDRAIDTRLPDARP